MKENMKQGDNFSNLQYFCQMIFGTCSIKMHTESNLIAQENFVLETFFYIFVIDLLRKSILQLAVTRYIEFDIRISFEFQIIITFE